MTAWFEKLNLVPIFTVSCLAGVLILVYVMQITWAESEAKEHSFVRWFRRVGQASLAVSFLWALSFANTHNWQPWPPFVAIVIAINVTLLGRVVSVAYRAPEFTMPRLQYKFLTLGIGFFTLLILVTAGLLLDRTLPYERSVGELIPPNVRVGDRVSVRWTGERKRDCPGTVHRVFVDSEGTYFPAPVVAAVYSNIGAGLPLVRELIIPSKMACGPAQYLARAEYYCNPTHRIWPIISNVPPVKFNVIC